VHSFAKHSGNGSSISPWPHADPPLERWYLVTLIMAVHTKSGLGSAGASIQFWRRGHR